jgi:hypothetical protein
MPPILIARTRDFWKSVAPILRTTAYVSWSLGIVALVLGWWGDLQGLWDDKPFATNVVSSVTTALFGIPIALIFLQYLAAHQARLATERTVIELANGIIDDLVEGSANLWPGDESSLQLISSHVDTYLREQDTRMRISNLDPSQPAYSETMYESLRSTIQLWNQHTVDGPSIEEARDGLADLNAFINTNLREDFAESNFRWISPGVQHRHSRALANLGGLAHLPQQVSLGGTESFEVWESNYLGRTELHMTSYLAMSKIIPFVRALVAYRDSVTPLTDELRRNARRR